MAMQMYSRLRAMEGDPWTRLQAAVIFQAFDDYVVYCKLLSGKRTSRGDYKTDPRAELGAIRAYIRRMDGTENGALTRALREYLKLRHVRDEWRASA